MSKGNQILASMLFNIETSTSELKKGLNAAKQQVNNFKDGTKKAFDGVKGMIGSAIAPFSGLISTIGLGTKGLMGMIPAINGVKTALIASGIGAIVVGLGVAFAALNSYFKGTIDGSNKLSEVMAYLKGGLEAVKVRIQLIGEAFSLLISGKFKQAAAKMKEAFSGGLMDEIRDKAKANLALQERENKLWQDKLDWGYKEAQLNTQKEDYLLRTRDTELDIFERAKLHQRAMEIDRLLGEERVRIANEEYQIALERSRLGNNSKEDEEELLRLFQAREQASASMLSSQRGMIRYQQTLNKELEKTGQELQNIKHIYDHITERSDDDILAGFDIAILESIDEIANAIEERDPLRYFADPTIMQEFRARMHMIGEEIKGQYVNVGVVIAEALTKSIFAINSALAMGGNNFKEYAQNIKAAAKQIIGAFIAEGVSAMVSNALKNAALTGPLAPFVAPAMAAAAAGIARTAFNSLIPGFADGGIVSGHQTHSDKVLARVNSGEMILNQGQQGNLFKMLDGGGFGGGGTFKFIIEGNTLVAIQDKMEYKNNIY
jgi:hypothetical protein